MVYVHNWISLHHKKEQNLAICDNMDRPREYYAKWNKSDGERQTLDGFTCRGNLKNKTNEQIEQNRSRVMDTEKRWLPEVVRKKKK